MLGGVDGLTQALPQSCAKTPTPSIPLARRSETWLCTEPLLLHVAGGDAPVFVSSSTCTGTLLATSPARVTSANATGPQVSPPANAAHSSMVCPFASVVGARVTALAVSTERTSRNPQDPVSTIT